MKNMNKKCYPLLLSAALLAGACNDAGQGESAAGGPVCVKTMAVAAPTGYAPDEYQGTVEEANGTDLSFATMGTVSSIRVNMGDRVAKGQLIATLDATTARSTHEAALAALARADDAFGRMRQLHDSGSLPEMKWVEAQSSLRQARAAEQAARKQLADCRLTAPFGGVIAAKMADAGRNVMPGTPVARLVSAGGQQVRMSVPEAEIGQINVGDKGRIDVAALGGKSYRATVTEKGVTANALSRSYDVRLKVDNADSRLLPGMVVSVTLSSRGATGYPVVPAGIVQIDERNKTFVWVVCDGKAARRDINCGEYVGDGVTVTSGLKAGERVIVEGSQKVCNGTKVKTI